MSTKVKHAHTHINKHLFRANLNTHISKILQICMNTHIRVLNLCVNAFLAYFSKISNINIFQYKLVFSIYRCQYVYG